MYRIHTIGSDGSYDRTSPTLIECADDSEALAGAAKLMADVEVWERERLVGACWVRPPTTEEASRPFTALIVAGVLASWGAVATVLYKLSALTSSARG